MEQEKTVKIEITYKSIVYIILILLGVYLIYILRELFLDLFIAFIFMSALKPSVDYCERKKIPRFAAAITMIVLVLLAVGLFLYYALPLLTIESKDFLLYSYRQVLGLLKQIDSSLDTKKLFPLTTLSDQIPNITTTVTKVAVAVLGNILHLISLVFFTIYFLLGINKLESTLKKILVAERVDFIMHILVGVEKKLGAWVRGEALLMTVIGIMSYIGLSLLGVKYALPLAVIAGILEVFPIIGPTISAIPAFLVAGSTSPLLAITTVILYIIIQQLENNLIVPLVMHNAVGISPLLILISLVVGEKLFGTIGIVLAVPLITTSILVIQETHKFPSDII